jgi:hypothetical protein
MKQESGVEVESADTDPASTVRSTKDDLRDLLGTAIDARLWALHGIGLALAERQRGSTPTESERARKSAAQAVEHWNALTLVAIFGGIEDFVESMGSDLHDAASSAIPEKRKEMFSRNRIRNQELKSRGELSVQGAQALTQFTARLADAFLLKPLRKPKNDLPTADRWEDLLGRIYMRPINGRPLPDDLRLTLNELGAVRNVLLHRMGRMDQWALEQVTEGPWRSVNEKVVIDLDLYARYIAALFSYVYELEDRIRAILQIAPQFDISAWRSAIPAGG